MLANRKRRQWLESNKPQRCLVVPLNELMVFLIDFIGDVGDKDPYMPNGLQVRAGCRLGRS
jgi:hypothetical protein